MARNTVAAFNPISKKEYTPYVGVGSSIKPSSGDKALQEFKFKSYDISNKYFDANETAVQLDRLLSGEVKSMMVIDTETIGKAITEYASVEYDMVSGAPVEKRATQVAFGLKDMDIADVKEAIRLSKTNPSLLTSMQKSILQRTSMYGGNFDDRFSFSDNKWIVNGYANSEAMNPASVEKGLNNLIELDRRWKGADKDVLKGLILEANQYAVSSNKALSGYNTSVYDLPVINSRAKDLGIDAGISAKNHLDMLHVAQLGSQGSASDYMDMVANSQGKRVGAIDFKNETAMKLVSSNSEAHNALNDVRGTIKTMFSKVGDEFLIENMQTTPSRTIDSNSSVNIVEALKSLKRGPLDYVEQLLDGKYVERTYGDWGTHRGHMYSMKKDALTFIDFESIKEQGKVDELKKLGYTDDQIRNGLWRLELESAASEGIGIKEKVTLFRTEKSDLQRMFQNEFAATSSKLTQSDIDLKVAGHVADNSRRSYMGIFEATGNRGFEYAEEMHRAFTDMQITLADKGLDIYELDNQQVKSFFNGGSIGDVTHSSTNLKAGGLFRSIEQQVVFANSFGSIRDTHGFMSEAIQAINDESAILVKADPYATTNFRKTMALSNTYEEAISTIASNIANGPSNQAIQSGGMSFKDAADVLKNYTVDQENWNHNSIVQVELDNKMYNLQVGNPADTMKSIKGAIEQSIPGYKSLRAAEKTSEEIRSAERLFEALKTQHALLPQDTSLYLDNVPREPGSIANRIQDLLSKNVKGRNFILDANKGFNLNSFEIEGLPMSDQLKIKGVDVSAIAKRQAASVQFFGQFDKTTGFKGISEGIKEALKSKYNYTTDNLDALSKVLYAPKSGLVTSKGLSAVLFDVNGTLSIALSKPQAIDSVIESINKGGEIRNAAIINLPKMEKHINADLSGNDIFTIVNGKMERLQSTSYQVYFKNNDIRTPRLAVKNTVSEMIDSAFRVADGMANYINEGKFDLAEDMWKRTMTAIMLGEPGATGVAVDFADAANGVLGAEKGVKMNAWDIINATSRHKTEQMVALLPSLYMNKENESLRKYLTGDQLGYGKEGIEDILFGRVIQKGPLKGQRSGGLQGKILSGEKVGPTSLPQSLNEFWVSNFLLKNKDMDNLSILDIIQRQTYGDEETAKSMSQLSTLKAEDFYQFAKDGDVASGQLMSKNVNEYVDYAFANSLNRTINRQLLSNVVLESDKIKGADKLIDEYGVQLHNTSMTEKYMTDVQRRQGIGQEQGIIGNVKIKGSDDIILDLEKNFGTASEIQSGNTTKISKWLAKGKFSHDIDVVESVVLEYYAHASTNEQHSLGRPSLGIDVFNQKELKTITLRNTDNMSEFENAVNTANKKAIATGFKGHVYSAGDEIFDGIKYEHHMPGFISSIDVDGGKYVINPLERSANVFKAIFSAEKSIVSYIGTAGLERAASEDIFTTLFGKNTVMASDPLFVKHLSKGTVSGSKLSTMAEAVDLIAKETGSKINEDFIREVNKAAPNLNAKFEEVTGHTRFIKSGNPAATAANANQFSRAVEIIEGLFKERITKTDISKFSPQGQRLMTSILESIVGNEIITNEGKTIVHDVIRSMISQGQYSENLSVSDELGHGKGVKLDPRIQQVALLGDIDKSGAYWLNHGGSQDHQFIFNDLWNEIKGSSQYKKAQETVGNTVNALRGANGLEVSAAVKNITTKDLLLTSKNVSIDDLKGTIFADEGVDVFKIKLGEGLFINDPLKEGGIITEVFLPRLKVEYSDDGKLMHTESQRSVTRFLETIKGAEEMNLDTGKFTVQETINRAYTNMLDRMSFDLSSDKNSYINQKLGSGRLSQSGIGVSTKIVDATSQDILSKGMYADMVEFNADGTAKKAFDLRFTSKQRMLDLGVDFEKVGRSVYRNGYYESIDMFQSKAMEFKSQFDSAIKDVPKEVERSKLFKELGEMWTKEVGLPILDTRYPTFRDRSTVLAFYRFSDSLSGAEEVTSSVTALGQHLDSDADIKSIIMLMKRDKNSGFLYDTNKMKALTDIYQHQATVNATDYDALHVEHVERMAKAKKGINLEDIHNEHLKYFASIKNLDLDEVKSMYNNGLLDENMLRDQDALIVAIKANQTKRAIGIVSNENLKLRDVASVFYKSQGEASSIDKYREVLVKNFTNLTEQKLIDTKHMSTSGYSKAEPYSNAMKMIFNKDKAIREKGLNLLDKTVGDLYTGESKVQFEEVKQQLRIIGSDTKAQESFFDKARYSSTAFSENLNSNSKWVGDRVKNAKLAAGNRVFIGEHRLRATDIVMFDQKVAGIDPGFYSVRPSTIGKSTGMIKTVFENVQNKQKITHYSNSIPDLQSLIKNHGRLIDASDIIKETNKLTNKLYSEISDMMSSGIVGYAKGMSQAIENSGSHIGQKVFSRVSSELAQEGEALKEFLGKVETFRRSSKVSDSTSGSMIAAMNQHIKDQGSMAETRYRGNEILLGGLSEAAEQHHIDSRRFSPTLNKQNYIDTAVPTDYSISSADTVTRINETPSINAETARNDVRARADAAVQSASDFERKAVGGERQLAESVNRKVSQLNKSIDEVADKTGKVMTGNYEQLGYNRDDSALSKLNWSNSKQTNEWVKSSNIEALSSQRVAFGDNAGRALSELTMDDIRKVVGTDLSQISDPRTLEAVGATQERVGAYLSALDNAKATHVQRVADTALDASDILATVGRAIPNRTQDWISSSPIITKPISEGSILAGKAKNVINSAFGDVARVAGDIKGPGMTVALGAAGALAAAILFQQTAKPGPLSPEKRANGSGDAPSPDGNYEATTVDYQGGAPGTTSMPTRLEEMPGMKYIIKARGNRVDSSALGSSIGSTVGTNNVNINIKDDSTSIDDSWIEQQFNKLLK